MLKLGKMLLAGSLLATIAAPVTAQEIGTVEATLLARYSLLDAAAAAEPAIGFGGRFGVFMLKNVALELSHAPSRTSDNPEARQNLFHLHLAKHINFGEGWAFILGAGWVRDRTNVVAPTGLLEADGVSGIVGLQSKFSERAAFRVDAIYDHLATARYAGPSAQAANLHFQAGFSLRWPPRDSDGDGVLDRNDACAGTPAGTPVDASGCALDADRDGVNDTADRCPNTPSGTPVNANGCPSDSDNDGVFDDRDRCASTPAGVPVDANGCPRDSDADGVLDNADQCGNTPAGTRVDATGCPIPVDSDRDGVLDNFDRCPNTPAGVRVDTNGCPLPVDSDGDGVRDIDDRCPNTPPGSRINARGCIVVFEEGVKNVVLEGVNFETGRAILTTESQSILDRVAESLVDSPEVNVEVQGHTDNTGSLALNTRLSAARAAAVRSYLIGKGVAAGRLTARGYGPSQPTASNTTVDGRAKNRRVELLRTN